MPQDAEARVWWADIDDVRQRIERRQASEIASAARIGARRGVREVRTGQRLALVRPQPQGEGKMARRRPRPRPVQRIGPRPDRIAAWAVALGVLLFVLALLSAHG